MQPMTLPGLSLACIALTFVVSSYTTSAETQWPQLDPAPSDDVWTADVQAAKMSDLEQSSATLDLLRLLQRELEIRQQSETSLDKRYRPSGFMGSRGKRFLPGLESLLLARYYQDAKWKRQPHSGFQGTRG